MQELSKNAGKIKVAVFILVILASLLNLAIVSMKDENDTGNFMGVIPPLSMGHPSHFGVYSYSYFALSTLLGAFVLSIMAEGLVRGGSRVRLAFAIITLVAILLGYLYMLLERYGNMAPLLIFIAILGAAVMKAIDVKNRKKDAMGVIDFIELLILLFIPLWLTFFAGAY